MKKSRVKSGKKDVHIEISEALCKRIRDMAEAEKRTFPSQVEWLLESHPVLSPGK